MKNIAAFLMLILLFTQCKNETKPTTNATPEKQEQTASTTVSKKNIVFFGNSLIAGYGLDNPTKDGFVGLIAARLDSLQLPYTCVNAGESGRTTSGGLSSVDWIIEQQPIDIFILELGGNDALRGIQPEESTKNLQSIIDKVKVKNPSVKIILAGMEAPRNMGNTYIKAFHDMYITLAKKNNIPLIPFILEGVGGIAELNQKDGIHPTEAGNKIVVENIWKTLKPVL